VKFRDLVMLVVLGLAGCASATYEVIKGTGKSAPPPIGYEEMCQRDPSAPLCFGRFQ
jgi:hypothetical protein